ncbi:MAG: DUF2797 domain-containing protein [Flavobacteriales bacterium]|nr:DUF2797 domain-containing protein [Flavobacteriales bacterium]
MKAKGNLRKMRTELQDDVQYFLNLHDNLTPGEEIHLNPLAGKEVKMVFDGQINCTISGKKINKTFGDGMSYEAFMSSPMAVPSIIRPELSRIHEGIALRDKEWEEKHHNQPHYVYLSKTSGIKVGVTRTTNVPFRWIDQGASEAIILAETPYRQLAGLIEVALKEHMADKTNWRWMLQNRLDDETDLLDKKDETLELLPMEYEEFFSDNDEITTINYPVLEYPIKLVSVKLDKVNTFEGILKGIKGQYLIFDNGRVMNVRSHAGYHIELEY